MISTDRNILKEGSRTRSRQLAYGEVFEELHIIILTTKKNGGEVQSLGKGVVLYPTNSISRFLYVVDAIRIGKSILKNTQGARLVTSQDPFETGIAGRALARSANLPFLVQLHTDIWSPYFKKSLLNRIRTWIAPHIFKYATGVRVVSERLKEGVLRAYRVPQEAVMVLPVHVDVSRIERAPKDVVFQKKYSKWRHIILMASRLTKEKDITTGIRSFAHVHDMYPDTVLVIVGEGPLKDQLVNIAKREGVSEHVFFEGWSENLPGMYKSAEVFLNTSLFEGYGMTLVEAGAAGCPVVTTDVGVAQELGEDVITAPVKDVGSISKAIITLLHEERERILMGKRLHSRIKKGAISFEEYVRRYGLVFERALKQGTE